MGKELTEIALQGHAARTIRIFSRGELLQHEMRLKFNDDERLRFFIGGVRDRDRMYRAMNGVDVVVHAAALKQVPTAEYNHLEAVTTNISGLVNVTDAAIDNGVDESIIWGDYYFMQPLVNGKTKGLKA